MADCKNYTEMISALADGALPDKEMGALREHLASCSSCRSLLSLYETMSQTISETLVEPPEDFTRSVMDKIKALPQDGSGGEKKSKHSTKSLKPIIISFVAAAACLALAFIVSPQLFGFGNLTNSAQSVPMPQLYASPSQAIAEDEILNSSAKYTQMDTQESAAAGGAEAPSEPPFGIMVASPDEKPPLGDGYGAGIARNGTDAALRYYAVFDVTGQLPELIGDLPQTDNGDGTFNIEITPETARQLLEEGFEAQMGAPDAPLALVRYTPGT